MEINHGIRNFTSYPYAHKSAVKHKHKHQKKAQKMFVQVLKCYLIIPIILPYFYYITYL